MTVWHPGFAHALGAAQTGDNAAFCDLWRMTNAALCRYLRVTAPQVVDDVASATWVRVARDLRQVRGGERDFRALVARIARDEAALRRRNQLRRPDANLDLVALEATRNAVDAGRAALGSASLTGETAVGLLTRLPADVAEMVAMRVVLGLDSGDTGSLVGARAGSVIVAVHSGLRRTSNLVGASAAHAAGPTRSVVPPNPWALDRLLDLGADGLDGLDPAMRAVVTALAEPDSPGDLGQLAPARAVFDRNLHRTFGLLPVFLLPLLARRLGAARTMLTGKVAAVAVGTAVLSAPAAIAYTDPEPTPAPRPVAVAAPTQTGATGLALSTTTATRPTHAVRRSTAVAPRVTERSAVQAAAVAARAASTVARPPARAKPPRASASGTTRSTSQHHPVRRAAASRPRPMPTPKPSAHEERTPRRHHHRPWRLILLLHRA